ncbi:MAG: hypothetical protein HYV38_02415 [Candidatus Levybacteria bacterium]|nr:hypothetical protein [Candidatus Levybacteria bacterium]MBI2420915.1 hypothetical protein [Candidatus Levybacteria bacterium]MBI4097639.1 hypothetical protein [Candidatus Levybacteria bacterium]
MHFIAFLLNVLSWIILGFFVGKKADNFFEYKRGKRIWTIGIISSVVGGMFGFLLNGLPNSSFSLNNFLYALVFSMAGVSVNNPNFMKKFKSSFGIPYIKLPGFLPRRRPAK